MTPDEPAGADASEWRDDVEADRLRDEAFRRLLDVPPKPQRQAKAGQPHERRPSEQPAEGAPPDRKP